MQNSANGESRSLHWVVSAGKEPLIVEWLLFSYLGRPFVRPRRACGAPLLGRQQPRRDL